MARRGSRRASRTLSVTMEVLAMGPEQRHSHRPGRLPKRMTDRLEDAAACLLAVAGVIGAVVVLMLAGQVHTAQTDRARLEAATRTPVTAVLLRDTVATVAGRAGEDTSVNVPVRWTGKDGTERDGVTSVIPPMRAGQTVTVWVDRDRQLVPAPLSTSDATVGAVLVGGCLLMMLIVALVLAWKGVRRWTLALNCVRWEREWTRVEPVWSGRTRGESRS